MPMPDRFEDVYGTDEDARRRALAQLSTAPDVDPGLLKLRAARESLDAANAAQAVPTTQGLPTPAYRPIAAPAGATASPKSTAQAPASKRLPKDDELEAAMGAERENAMWMGLSRAGAMASAALTHRKFDSSNWDELAKSGMSPVQQLMASRAAGAEKAKAAAAAAKSDPNSPESIRFRAVIAKTLPGVYSPEELAQMTAADEKSVLDYGKLRGEMEARRLSRQESAERFQNAREERGFDRAMNERHFQAQMAESRAARGENHEMQLLLAQMHAKNQKDLKQMEKESSQHLPASEAASLGEADAAVQSLNDLGKAYDTDIASGFGHSMTGLTQYVPGTDATKYGDKMRATAQSVGTFLEGGKLAAGDEPKYLRMLPNPGDGAERKKVKIDTLNRLIELKRQGKLQSLKAAGFNTGNLSSSGMATPKPDIDLTAAPPPASGNVRMRTPDGTVVDVPREKAEEFKRDYSASEVP